MAKRELENEVKEILSIIDKGQNFLLSGGAGSGKTYSLVDVIKETIKRNPKSKIACMTYTNASVREIDERVDHANLQVSTIHDFLWNNISEYQKELKKSLLVLINDDNSRIRNPNLDSKEKYTNNFIDGIRYREYLNISEGIISHDEVLILASYMYKEYKLLCNILIDKYPFIFIDEYQDTSPYMIDILLGHINKSDKKNILGFFGDSMQSIYDEGIGDLNKYVESKEIIEVQKVQNRRNPQLVIDLANRTRVDGLQQEPSKDENAPNMRKGLVKQGSIKFLYSKSSDIEKIKESKYFANWNFDNASETKELNLTHNLIATKAGYPNLMEVYNSDPILKFKKKVAKYIKQNNIDVGENKTFGEVVKVVAEASSRIKTDLNSIVSIENDKKLYSIAEELPYSKIRKMYWDKDCLIDDKKNTLEDESRKGSKRDDLIKHLFKIQTLIHLYKEKDFNEFIRKTNYDIRSFKDKSDIKDIVEKAERMSESNVEDIINYADEKRLCLRDDRINTFIANNPYLYSRVSKVKFMEFQNLFYYLEGYTPFSTQHKIKGTEFNDVFVILDNGRWNNYNFEYLLNEGIFHTLTPSKKRSFPRILLRTQKIFYVCCTRAKENLIVYYSNPTQDIIDTAKKWFGDKNVHKVKNE